MQTKIHTYTHRTDGAMRLVNPYNYDYERRLRGEDPLDPSSSNFKTKCDNTMKWINKKYRMRQLDRKPVCEYFAASLGPNNDGNSDPFEFAFSGDPGVRHEIQIQLEAKTKLYGERILMLFKLPGTSADEKN